ncbi:hypothetical protein GUITHDRAFT_141501 [Guillardia theta CCMP2712]|uniref:Transmembrane protein n=1 Tax=Guillardia theta (strain CCMP2712) TaxID=905079 RepID=L1J126_GUITC|nr:hypothetical protein GUITHDRAFT_141501 [Guillardia theta CCMP2712]EKX42027.1 hypothetical protein GUITHDRAFT_141501 [Guillardia theta CCMP2712]|eukprot:XP_005829007.1 hypothetical protein GUITHDRAFT_141501 [Guillardia theta CCMP2712]
MQPASLFASQDVKYSSASRDRHDANKTSLPERENTSTLFKQQVKRRVENLKWITPDHVFIDSSKTISALLGERLKLKEEEANGKEGNLLSPLLPSSATVKDALVLLNTHEEVVLVLNEAGKKEDEEAGRREIGVSRKELLFYLLGQSASKREELLSRPLRQVVEVNLFAERKSPPPRLSTNSRVYEAIEELLLSNDDYVRIMDVSRNLPQTISSLDILRFIFRDPPANQELSVYRLILSAVASSLTHTLSLSSLSSLIASSPQRIQARALELTAEEQQRVPRIFYFMLTISFFLFLIGTGAGAWLIGCQGVWRDVAECQGDAKLILSIICLACLALSWILIFVYLLVYVGRRSPSVLLSSRSPGAVAQGRREEEIRYDYPPKSKFSIINERPAETAQEQPRFRTGI